MSRLFLIAGEPSGDALGAALMAGLKELEPGIEFTGVGGPLMEAQGMKSLFPMEELSVMGLAEVLPRYNQLVRRIKQCAGEVLDQKPDALVTIDSPDFSLRVAKRVKEASDIRTVHYVAPTVWAWREGRAKKMAGMIDQVLALFPFEPPYMEAEGMRCDFVGHPVVAQPTASPQEVAEFRETYGLAPDAHALLVLPGSRKGEVGRLAPIFGEALRPLLARHPALHVIVPAAPAVFAEVKECLADWPGQPILLDPQGKSEEQILTEKRAAFSAANVALAASGTVSLELAAARTPMVIAYDMNWFSFQIIKWMMKIDTVTLVNIVSETRVVPELLGSDCKPEAISEALLALLDDDAARQAQLAAQDLTMERLGKGGAAPGLRAARAVLDGLKQA
ncbi:lipid-A-disaccharide synthase [Actibacterium lipolyticum]|uniref:Lipid-A-disaccharide synthase n=1 Tax=Actibacterium lipolyticum TaxID=1524263 RepID=A0A238JYQ0_9RHOB|nr:lipid-A-disaccharide synthase [Actibacterium lipolyticum]SMX34962.1 Lipid-A-disaccharide synthase [Actibacterium lipolyticum]